jgi:hypothetical protein
MAGALPRWLRSQCLVCLEEGVIDRRLLDPTDGAMWCLRCDRAFRPPEVPADHVRCWTSDRGRLAVACPRCGRGARLELARVPAGGAPVRCGGCHHPFVALQAPGHPAQPEPPPAPVDRPTWARPAPLLASPTGRMEFRGPEARVGPAGGTGRPTFADHPARRWEGLHPAVHGLAPLDDGYLLRHLGGPRPVVGEAATVAALWQVTGFLPGGGPVGTPTPGFLTRWRRWRAQISLDEASWFLAHALGESLLRQADGAGAGAPRALDLALCRLELDEVLAATGASAGARVKQVHLRARLGGPRAGEATAWACDTWWAELEDRRWVAVLTRAGARVVEAGTRDDTFALLPDRLAAEAPRRARRAAR